MSGGLPNLGPMKHAARARVPLGGLPDKLRHLERQVHHYRRLLEQAVVVAHGGITVDKAHAIQTAAAAFQHALIAHWVLRHKFTDMAPETLLRASETTVKASERMAAAVAKLNLEPPPPDPLDDYDPRRRLPAPPQAGVESRE
jgi:hypothetical protein